jgi:hypothetical protein
MLRFLHLVIETAMFKSQVNCLNAFYQDGFGVLDR